ncbi:MAG: zinc ribbon domain-containing protein, partial [Lachnospiraceae bacterium]|nr:zinc ribbon domain-containing protein [Lachnospiraceae bacterium]
MAFCQNCGNELPGGAPFCPHCGAAQQQAAPQQMQMRQQQPVPQQMPQQQPFASQMQQQAAPQRQMRQPQPPAKKSKKGLIIGLVCGGVVLVAGIVVLLVLLLGKKGSYQVFVEDRLQGVFTEGQRVTLQYPLATDTSYTFSSDDVSFTEEYEDWTAIIAFTMPAHDVTIHVNSSNTMQPQPEPEPEPEPEPGPDPIATMFGEEGWVQGNEPVSVAFPGDVSLMTENLDAIEMDTSEYALRLVFGAKENVYDVTLYTGMIVDFTSDSAVFEYQEKLFLGDMLPREFFLAEMSFAGDFPTNAFSCVDENGRTHTYMIGTSGMDSSLYLEECTLQEADATDA